MRDASSSDTLASFIECLPVHFSGRPPLPCLLPTPGDGTPDMRLGNAQVSLLSLCLSLPPPELAFGAYTDLLQASDVGLTFAWSQLPQWVDAFFLNFILLKYS